MKHPSPPKPLSPGSGSVHILLLLATAACVFGVFGNERLLSLNIYDTNFVYSLRSLCLTGTALLFLSWLGYVLLERYFHPLHSGWLRLHILGSGLLPLGLFLLDKGQDPLLYFSGEGPWLERLGRVVLYFSLGTQLLFPLQLIRALVLSRRPV